MVLMVYFDLKCWVKFYERFLCFFERMLRFDKMQFVFNVIVNFSLLLNCQFGQNFFLIFKFMYKLYVFFFCKVNILDY